MDRVNELIGGGLFGIFYFLWKFIYFGQKLDFYFIEIKIIW